MIRRYSFALCLILLISYANSSLAMKRERDNKSDTQDILSTQCFFTKDIIPIIADYLNDKEASKLPLVCKAFFDAQYPQVFLDFVKEFNNTKERFFKELKQEDERRDILVLNTASSLLLAIRQNLDKIQKINLSRFHKIMIKKKLIYLCKDVLGKAQNDTLLKLPECVIENDGHLTKKTDFAPVWPEIALASIFSRRTNNKNLSDNVMKIIPSRHDRYATNDSQFMLSLLYTDETVAGILAHPENNNFALYFFIELVHRNLDTLKPEQPLNSFWTGLFWKEFNKVYEGVSEWECVIKDIPLDLLVRLGLDRIQNNEHQFHKAAIVILGFAHKMNSNILDKSVSKLPESKLFQCAACCYENIARKPCSEKAAFVFLNEALNKYKLEKYNKINLKEFTDKNIAWFYLRSGQAQMEFDNKIEANSCFSRCMRNSDKNDPSHQMAKTLTEWTSNDFNGWTRDQVQDLKNTEHPMALAIIGKSLSRQGKYKEAGIAFEAYLQHSCFDPYDGKLSAFFDQDEAKKTLNYLQNSTDNDDKEIAISIYATAYEHRESLIHSEKTKALGWGQIAAELSNNPSLLEDLAVEYAHNKNYQQASLMYAQAGKLFYELVSADNLAGFYLQRAGACFFEAAQAASDAKDISSADIYYTNYLNIDSKYQKLHGAPALGHVY